MVDEKKVEDVPTEFQNSPVEDYAAEQELKETFDSYPVSKVTDTGLRVWRDILNERTWWKIIRTGYARQGELGLPLFPMRTNLDMSENLDNEYGLSFDSGMFCPSAELLRANATMTNMTGLSFNGLFVQLPGQQVRKTKISGDKKSMTKKSWFGETKVEEGGDENDG